MLENPILNHLFLNILIDTSYNDDLFLKKKKD